MRKADKPPNDDGASIRAGPAPVCLIAGTKWSFRPAPLATNILRIAPGGAIAMEDAMHTAIPLTVLATALACSLATTPANARARVFVASYGNDANPCTFGSPCKTFQQAVNVVDPGGEVTAIDSAGFGPITITQAVTITSPDGVEAGIVPAAGGNAITINAGPTDAVVLRGLTLNGSGIAFNGVVFDSGASLTITNCVMQNFVFDGSNGGTGNGIYISPTPSTNTVDFTITNTAIANIGTAGIFYSPSSGTHHANGIIDHVTVTGSHVGIDIFTSGVSSGTTTVGISNSIVSNSSGSGINAAPGGSAAPLTVSIDNTTVSSNLFGINGGGTAKVLLGRSVIIGNGTGISNNTSPSTFFTYKDNRINENTTDICNTGLCVPLNTTLALQ
jgi:hypothetical protein